MSSKCNGNFTPNVMPPLHIRDHKVYLIYSFFGNRNGTPSERVEGLQNRFDLAREYLLSRDTDAVCHQMDEFIPCCSENHQYLTHCQLKYVLPDMLPTNYEVILSLHEPADLTCFPSFVHELIDARHPKVLPQYSIFCQGWMDKNEFVHDTQLFQLQSMLSVIHGRFPVAFLTLEMCGRNQASLFLVSQYNSWQKEQQESQDVSFFLARLLLILTF
jgi:hypothetical protein